MGIGKTDAIVLIMREAGDGPALWAGSCQRVIEDDLRSVLMELVVTAAFSHETEAQNGRKGRGTERECSVRMQVIARRCSALIRLVAKKVVVMREALRV